ncbi:thymic stromal cotransporter homolog isoform X1 [Portunus trituberculatus]|nr:thymic stromal cotransporter homolog isoform X1 [Portunus trituberculatus]XP_045101999.1 thymic stromal cotransporter homolog isoform X1 [Portunus trituberculatus]XP_045102000.1 thymic stromal cotransporter homolog isoform X1 [Portunus trituberculatus]
MFRVTVEPAVLLYCVSYMVQLSVLQDFIFTKLCSEQYSQEVCVARWKEDTVTDVACVENQAVNYVMWLSVITSILSVIMAQFFGVALDRYSPKAVMTAPFMGFLAQHLVCVVVAAMPTVPLAVMYVGATLNGLSGGYPLFKSAVSSYVVRTASPKERTFLLSVVEGTVFLGGALGPFTLKQVVTSTTVGHDYLFLGSEMSLVVALLYIVFILPDSQSTSQENAELPPEHSGTTLFTPVKSVLKNFTGSVSTVLRHRPAGKRTSILLLILADFFIAVVYSAEFDLLYMYMHNYLGFNLDQYSLYLVIKNLVNGISLLGVLPLLRLVFDSSDASLGILGGASRMVAFTMLALNSSHTLTYIVPFLDVFGQYLFVVLRSSLCGLVNKEEQGRVLTVLSSLAQMSMLVGSLLFDNVYPALVLLAHPGYTFLMAATSMATATTIFICIRCCRAKEGTSEETQPILR